MLIRNGSARWDHGATPSDVPDGLMVQQSFRASLLLDDQPSELERRGSHGAAVGNCMGWRCCRRGPGVDQLGNLGGGSTPREEAGNPHPAAPVYGGGGVMETMGVNQAGLHGWDVPGP